MSKNFLYMKRKIKRHKTYFTNKKQTEYLLDSEIFAPLGRIENDKKEIIYPDPILDKKRKIILKFFPNLAQEITSDFKDEDIKKILRTYKSNITGCKLKKKLDYVQNFNPELKQNIENWRIDYVLSYNKECQKLIDKSIKIIEDNKKSKNFKDQEIIDLLLLCLSIDNTNEYVQKNFIRLTNNIFDVTNFESFIKSSKNKDINKEEYEKLNDNLKHIIKERFIIKSITKEENNNNNIIIINDRDKFFNYVINFANIIEEVEKTNSNLLNAIENYIKSNSKSNIIMNTTFPWDDTKRAFFLSKHIDYKKGSYHLYTYYEGAINDAFDNHKKSKLQIFTKKMTLLKPIFEQMKLVKDLLLDENEKEVFFLKLYFMIFSISYIDEIETLIPKLKDFNEKDVEKFINIIQQDKDFEVNVKDNTHLIITRKIDKSQLILNPYYFNLDELYKNIKINFHDLNNDFAKYRYYNFRGLKGHNIFYDNLNKISPYYFIITQLSKIMCSKFICYLQDTSSFIDIFLGPGIYYYSIFDNLIDSLENTFLFPFYNENFSIIKKINNVKKKENKDEKKISLIKIIKQNKENIYSKKFINNNYNNINNSKNIISFPYFGNDGITDRQTDMISISCFLRSVIDVDIVELQNLRLSLLLLFGCARLLIIIIHELIGHLLKSKVNRISKRKIMNYTESNPNKKYNKKEGGMFLEFKMFGKSNKIFTYSQCINILNYKLYDKNPDEFKKEFEFSEENMKLYESLDENLKSFLNTLGLDEKKIQLLIENKATPGVPLRPVSPFNLSLIKIPFNFL